MIPAGFPMIGQTLSHFRIIEQLGAGGMGEVFVAEDTNLHRKVALKVSSKQLAADPKGREMLFKEARTASRLTHPNIATVYEVDLVDERAVHRHGAGRGQEFQGPSRAA